MPLTRIKLTAIADGGITSAKLANNSVTIDKLANTLYLDGQDTAGDYFDVRLPQGVGGTNWTNPVKTVDFTATPSNGYFVDTSAGNIVVTLPSSPSIGDYVSLVDYAGTNSVDSADAQGFYTNRIMINPNGSKINGQSAYKDIGSPRGGAQLVYVDTTQGWIVTDAANEDTVKALLPSTPKINVGGIVNALGFQYFQQAGDTITVTGTGFLSGVSVILIDQIGSTEYTADNIVLTGDTQIEFDIPAGVISSSQVTGEDPFDVKILNSNGSFVLQSNVLEYAPTPTFDAGQPNNTNLGTVTATTNDANSDAFSDLSASILAASLDPDDTVTYSITTLPSELTGLSIDANTGALSGGIPSAFPADDTTSNYTFTVTATATSAETSNTKTDTRDFVITLEGNVSAPTVTSVNQNYISQSGTSITVIGTGFKETPTVTLIAPDATEYVAATVNYVSATEINFVTTSAMATAIETVGQVSGDERFDIKVTNPSGTGSYSKEGTLANAFEYKPTPTFNVASGSVGQLLTTTGQDYSTLTTTTLDATELDPDDTLAYSLKNVATELANLVINSSSGAISGTADLSSVTPGTYNFTVVVSATSAETGNVTTDNRVYSIEVVADSFYSLEITNSLRFDGSSYLSRTPTTGGSNTTFTLSFWVKRSKLGAVQYIGISSSDSSGGAVDERNLMRFNADDTLTIGFNPTASTWHWYQTNQVFRDTSAFMQFVVSVDASNGTGSEKVKIYVNGVRIPQSEYSQFSTTLTTTYMNTVNQPHALFAYVNSGYANDFEGYAANIHFIDGQALDASSFGELVSGVWVPKAYTGTYGTNGFHLDFADPNDIGNDVSGNNNHWTVN